ncbi:hypothetical protein KP509_02G097600 [Ceratopteris richardii]|uniref:Phytocyanin domain-containing protein n=1 Tax=Ceratopteris richardii TaxID=49495 RepID=A0A8T2VCY5_CERRI|nr:hypothetical protein KP509_02G097600 [Ceratopteris richardii]
MEGGLPFLVLLLNLYVGLSAASTFKVGGDAGWALNVDMQAWADSQRFYPGDVLEFDYNKEAHDVVEVTEEGFERCTAEDAIATFRSGADRIALQTESTRYFICSVPGHCPAGMKVRIQTV